jgi:hypothetical protein
LIYLVCFAAVLCVNIIPAFTPPTWTVLVFFLSRYNLAIAPLVLCGVAGATLGRTVLSSYVRFLSDWLFNDREKENLQFVGQRLMGKTAGSAFRFALIYSLTPLSTTVLFVAASLAGIKKRYILPGFALGRAVSYTVLAFSTRLLAEEVADMFHGQFSGRSIAASSVASVAVLAFIFLDWKAVIEQKTIRFNLHVFK